MLYAASIWYNDHRVINQRLQSMQKDLLLGISKCYGTTPMDVLIILSGVLPLNLRAGLERDYVTLTRKGRSIEGTALSPETVEMWNSILL